MGFFIFTKVYSKHLGYLLALDSQPYPIWKISRGTLLGFLRSLFVWASCLRFTTQILLRYQLLLPVFLLFPLVWRSCVRLLIVSLFSLFIAEIIQSSQMDCLATVRDVPGSLVLAFWCYRLVTKKVSWYFLPFYPKGLLWWPSLLIFCE